MNLVVKKECRIFNGDGVQYQTLDSAIRSELRLALERLLKKHQGRRPDSDIDPVAFVIDCLVDIRLLLNDAAKTLEDLTREMS